MRIRILKSAQDDLRDGYWFYESQETGVGDYFLDSLKWIYYNYHIPKIDKKLYNTCSVIK